MPGATERLIDWTVRSLQAANVAAKDREVPFFAILAAISIPWQDYYAAAIFAACMAVCQFLAHYPLNGGPLPTRERFLKSVPRIQAGNECPVCYDDPNIEAALPCCGGQLCDDCLQLVYGPNHQDNRCPTCRAPLFQMRAPWNNTSIKVAFCRCLVGLLEHGVQFAAEVLDTSSRSRFLYAVVLVCPAVAFIFSGWFLLKMLSKMNSGSASFWRLLTNDAAVVILWPTFLVQTVMAVPGISGKIQRIIAPEYNGVKDLIAVD